MTRLSDPQTLNHHTLAHIRRAAKRLARDSSLPGMAAEDIEQDLFLDLWRRTGAFDPARASFRTFADRVIAHRVATLTSPTTRLRAERTMVSLDAPLSRDDSAEEDDRTWSGSLPDPAAAAETDLGLVLDVRRFLASLSPALLRCCDILASPNVTTAARETGLHRSRVYADAARLRKRAVSAGLQDYLSARAGISLPRPVNEQHAFLYPENQSAVPRSATPPQPAQCGGPVGHVGADPREVAITTTGSGFPETGWPGGLQARGHRGVRGRASAPGGTLMDPARAAAMSDPDRNRFFHRRWTEPLPGKSGPLMRRPEPDSLELTGQELLTAWRNERARHEEAPR